MAERPGPGQHGETARTGDKPTREVMKMLDLTAFVDLPLLQSMMDDFYALARIPMTLLDTKGNVLVGAGWQDVCMSFHRANPETCANCTESDLTLAADIPAGESRLYRCKNGMWDAAMPVEVGGQRVGTVFTGQFFFDDEDIDLGFFRQQASRYDFDEADYIAAVEAAPRLSRKDVELGLGYLTKLARMIAEFATNAAETEQARLELQAALEAEAAVAAENARLYELEREASSYSQALNRMNRLVHSHRKIGEILNQVVVEARGSLKAESAAVFKLDGEDVVELASSGFEQDISGMRLPALRSPHGLLALETKQAVAIDDALNDERVEPDLMKEYGIRSVLVIPLLMRDDVLGVLYFNYHTNMVHFSEMQIDFANKLAAALALALENARLYQIEHSIAETLQQTLVELPSEVPGVSFSRAYGSATSEAGRVGGDFIDLFEVQPGTVGIVIGDVSGKGMEAAVVTSLVRNTVRAHAIDGLLPNAVCAKTNKVVCRFTEVDAYVTLFFGLLNTETGLLRYVGAGHPEPLLLSADGTAEPLLSKNPILGAYDTAQYLESQAVLGEGERLLLYTDGVTEARSPERDDFFGFEGLTGTLAELKSAPTDQLAGSVMDAVVAYSGGLLRDDAAILAVERSGAPEAT